MTRIRKSRQVREFERILIRNGYRFARSRGSHFIYYNAEKHKHISINQKLNTMVRQRLIKENNLEV